MAQVGRQGLQAGSSHYMRVASPWVWHPQQCIPRVLPLLKTTVSASTAQLPMFTSAAAGLIGRAWRMGQQREVTVKKFYVKVGARVVERWGQCCALYV